MKLRIVWGGLSICLMILAGTGRAEEKMIRGELAEGDKTFKQSDGLVDYHVVRAKAGDLMTVTMKAKNESELDTYLVVVGPSGQEYANDDAEEGGSKVSFRVPETGEWEIAAAAYDDGKGAYTVTVTTQALKLILGERGELEEGDEVLLKEGELYDKFAIEVEAGKTYVVMAASNDFSSFVAVHYPGGFVNSHDSEGDASLVVFSPKKAGQATIVMTSSYDRAKGRYRIAAYEAVAAGAQEKDDGQ